MNSISKNMYIDKLDDTVLCSNTYSTIKMKPVDVKSSSYIDFNKNNKEGPKFKVGDHVRISKYFCKRLLSKLIWRGFWD